MLHVSGGYQQTILKGELPMSDEFNKQDYEQKIAELEKQLEEAKKTDDTFDDLKQKYEKTPMISSVF